MLRELREGYPARSLDYYFGQPYRDLVRANKIGLRRLAESKPRLFEDPRKVANGIDWGIRI